ncbi:MAG: fructosamine kinase family protein [Bacteroidetes bacterium]|nr:fructosamine kinase family protein [Bacteroidota bacterium]
MISSELGYSIGKFLSETYSKEIHVINSSYASGGCINDSAIINTNEGKFFLKWNIAKRYPNMFEAEAKGLNLLKSAGILQIPEVIGVGTEGQISWLLLEYIESQQNIGNFWEDFGKSLAKLHKQTSLNFGLDHNNYIGSLHQCNDFKQSWIDFFIEQRLGKQIKLAADNGKLGRETKSRFEKIYNKLSGFFPTEPPSLLHGDLWSGNFMTGSHGKACIYDPAVYYGHRLMDIAMSKLFGGFSESFYAYYNAEYPLEKNWQEAIDIANLYPLMVHVNLFGGGYIGSVDSILKRYC